MLNASSIARRMMALLLFFGTQFGAMQAATAQDAASSPSAGAVSTPRPYTINAGDEIEVYVWGEERLQRAIRVLPDGTFSFPLVGRVEALGQLPSQIEAKITKGLQSQYRGDVPQVTVSVRSPAGFQVSVVGKVKAAGTFTPGRYINVLEALSLAGGPDEFANLDNVAIVRKTGTGLTALRARLAAPFKNGPTARDLSGSFLQLESGDTVIVP